jgi:predicted RNA-binding Zn-ribbon protein involved in translation (DUF1610 family)
MIAIDAVQERWISFLCSKCDLDFFVQEKRTPYKCPKCQSTFVRESEKTPPSYEGNHSFQSADAPHKVSRHYVKGAEESPASRSWRDFFLELFFGGFGNWG